jgi:hypothetical protein
MPYSTIFLVFRSQYHVAEFVKGPWPIVYSHQVVFSQVQLETGGQEREGLEETGKEK